MIAIKVERQSPPVFTCLPIPTLPIASVVNQFCHLLHPDSLHIFLLLSPSSLLFSSLLFLLSSPSFLSFPFPLAA